MADEFQNADGIYKVRSGHNNEKLIQMRNDVDGEYRRFTENDGKRIVFLKV